MDNRLNRIKESVHKINMLMNRLNQQQEASMKGFKLVLVDSDNFKGVMTEQAYKELTLQMSSEDYGAHTWTKFKPRNGHILGLTSNTEVYDIHEETVSFEPIGILAHYMNIPVEVNTKGEVRNFDIRKIKDRDARTRFELMVLQQQGLTGKVISMKSYRKEKRVA